MSRLKRFLRKPLTLGASVVLAGILVMAIAPDFIAPHDPSAISVPDRLLAPAREHPFGTDHLGRDVLSRTVFGARNSLIMGLGVAALSGLFGVFVGLVAAFSAPVRVVAMRVVDMMMAFPAILLALTIMAVTGKAAFENVLLALVIVYTPRVARVAYALALTVQEMLFIEASRAIGARAPRTILRHILPNLLSPIIVLSTFTCAWAVLGAASLDFLGVGVPPTVPSWGGIINESRLYITRAPWIGGYSGAVLFLFVMSLNLLGDALRDALDPKLRRLL